MRSIRFAQVVSSCLALAACSGAEVKPWPQQIARMGYQMGPAVDAVPHYSVEGAMTLDNRHVLINNGTSTDYLITLANDCEALHAAESIAFSSTSGDLALSDELLVHQVGANYKCPLEAFNALRRG
jgi:hypothetical protein